MDVGFGDLREVRSFRPGTAYDVICCSDALYFLSNEEIADALLAFKERLRPGGIILVNIHAFRQFSGMHDLAVGSSRRFTFRDFRKYTAAAGLAVTYRTYWPFTLSFPILLVRTWQRIQIRRGALDTGAPDSDVSYPGDLINALFGGITHLEQLILPSAPFGSSLFMVMKPSA